MHQSWKPISEHEVQALITRELLLATREQQSLYARLAVPLERWTLSPWGDQGGGFWVAAVQNDQVIWYNDIEDGFNVSTFVTRGTIPTNQYWCNQDELGWALASLGTDRPRAGPPQPLDEGAA